MAGRLAGKIAIVTGAAQGLGAATVRRFCEEGARVLATDVLDELGAESIVPHREAAGYEHLDVTSESGWQRAVARCVERFGTPTVLVNNAAIVRMQPIHEETLDGWNSVLAVNVTGAFLGMRAVVPQMQVAGGGSIVNIASIWGLVGASGAAAYQASKGAITLLSKNGAITYVGDGIRVNSVHPGGMKTALIDEARCEDDVAAATPLGRVAKPEEVVEIVVYLGSDESRFATGAQFVVDGGYTAL